jgi:hypothetical protein
MASWLEIQGEVDFEVCVSCSRLDDDRNIHTDHLVLTSATNVTIPEAPQWSSDSIRKQEVDEDIPAILGSQMYFSGEDDQYSRSMKEYRRSFRL